MANALHIRTPTLELDARQTRQFADFYAEAPGLTFAAAHFAVKGIFFAHRERFLSRTQVKFRAGGQKVQPVNSNAQGNPGRTFFYKVTPDKPPRNSPNVPPLSAIRGETFTTSKVAQGLETGGVFRSKRGTYLAIPIGRTKDRLGRTIGKFNSPRKFANKDTFTLPAGALKGRPSGSSRIMYWREKKRGGYIIHPIFRLVRQVTRRPLLGFYKAWDEMGDVKAAKMQAALDFIAARFRKTGVRL